MIPDDVAFRVMAEEHDIFCWTKTLEFRERDEGGSHGQSDVAKMKELEEKVSAAEEGTATEQDITDIAELERYIMESMQGSPGGADQGEADTISVVDPMTQVNEQGTAVRPEEVVENINSTTELISSVYVSRVPRAVSGTNLFGVAQRLRADARPGYGTLLITEVNFSEASSSAKPKVRILIGPEEVLPSAEL
jgi:hypothetical protein